MTKLGLLAGLSLVLAGCASDGTDGINGTNGTNGTDGKAGTDGTDGSTGPAGPQLALPALYTLTNDAAGNQVSSYLTAVNGNLSRKGSFATGGKAKDMGLGSQGALAFDAKSQRFFAVNAGDAANDTISMLALSPDGVLKAMSTVPSGGAHPVSITVHGDTVYVLNQGDFPVGGTATPAKISGFLVDGNTLKPIANSTQALSATTNVHPTDIAFTPDGGFLVVAEEGTPGTTNGSLDTFPVDANGVAHAGTFLDPTTVEAGNNPFAFDFSPDGFLVVANVGGGNPSSVSSFQIMNNGTLMPMTALMSTDQAGACWIVTAGDFAYIANTGSATITTVDVAPDGTLTQHGDGTPTDTGAGPFDLAVSPDHGFLYSLASAAPAGGVAATANQEIHVFGINPNGNLDTLGVLPSVPSSASGLVAR